MPRSVCICVMCMEHLYDKSRMQLNDESSTQMLINMKKQWGCWCRDVSRYSEHLGQNPL